MPDLSPSRLTRGCALWAAVVVSFGLSACAKAPEGAAFNDPYESFNRRVYEGSKRLDRAILRPVGMAIAEAPPESTQPIVNFADNLGLPSAVLNGLLQGDLKGAISNTGRFILNTTLGIGGLLDPAGDIGLTEQKADFGETLAVWGVPEGAYLFLPVLGPSTTRDAFGELVDAFIDPLAVYGTPDLNIARTVTRVEGRLIDRGRFGDTVDSVLYDSADGYAQTRLIYLQNRRFDLGPAGGTTYVDPYADPAFALPDSGFADPYAN